MWKPTKEKKTFGSEPDLTRYLEVPDNETPHPEKHIQDRDVWLRNVRSRASLGSNSRQGKNPVSGYTAGDILVFVHGYNTSITKVMERHNQLQQLLRTKGFCGAIVTYDWPSADHALNYLEDRSDARKTAHLLVEDGIRFLALAQRRQDEDHCDIDVHLLGHSTGAYVIREAFYEASGSRTLARINWNVSQIVFIGGDIAKSSLGL